MSTLRIYMKSGNVIKLSGIKDWKVRAEAERVTYLSIERHNFANFFGKKERLIVPSICLGQVEAITEE